jgi:hypothetical protein
LVPISDIFTTFSFEKGEVQGREGGQRQVKLIVHCLREPDFPEGHIKALSLLTGFGFRIASWRIALPVDRPQCKYVSAFVYDKGYITFQSKVIVVAGTRVFTFLRLVYKLEL